MSTPSNTFYNQVRQQYLDFHTNKNVFYTSFVQDKLMPCLLANASKGYPTFGFKTVFSSKKNPETNSYQEYWNFHLPDGSVIELTGNEFCFLKEKLCLEGFVVKQGRLFNEPNAYTFTVGWYFDDKDVHE